MNNEGKITRSYNGPVRRYCRMLHLRPGMAEAYRNRHSARNIWDEILAGIKEVGILEMELWLLGDTDIMILETPVDFDLDAAMARLATLPRQQEWEDYMSIFQQAEPGETSDQKWQPMERIFHLYSPEELAEARRE